MSELVGIARFRLDAGAGTEFKRLSERCMEIVRTKDTGTLQHDIYLDDAESCAVVIERYRDSAALIEHLTNIGEELMSAMNALGTVEGELLGEPSDTLRESFDDDGPVRLYPRCWSADIGEVRP